MIYEQKQDLEAIVDFIVVCMDDMEMVKQCNEWIKGKQDDGLRIVVYFVKDSNKYKHSLRDSLKLILIDLNLDMTQVKKIWILQEKINFILNVIGCVAASIIIQCAQAKSDWIDLKFWVKFAGDRCDKNGVILSKTKIRDVLDKFQFILDFLQVDYS